MNGPHDLLRESLVDFVLGNLDDAEARKVEAHLAEGCAECNADVRELRETLALVAALSDREPAPSAARGRILVAITQSASEERRQQGGLAGHHQSGDRQERHDRDGRDEHDVRRRRDRGDATPIFRMPMWGRAALVGLAAACLLLAVDGVQLRKERILLRNEVVLSKARIVQLESQVDESQQWADLVTAGNAQFAQLAPTPDADPAMTAWAIYDPSSRRAAIVVDSVEPNDDRDFELWAIAGGAPKSLGVITPDANGRGIVRIDAVSGDEPVAAFAVSREPKGGSPDKTAPSGPVVLVGALGD